MRIERIANKLMVVLCLLPFSGIGCGKTGSETVEKKEESNATVKVTMPDGAEGQKAATTFVADSEESSKVGETIGVEGVISIPSLNNKESSQVVPIQIIMHRPNKVPTVTGGVHGHLKSLGDNRYRYTGELKSPLKPGKYELEIVFGTTKVASKNIVVTK